MALVRGNWTGHDRNHYRSMHLDFYGDDKTEKKDELVTGEEKATEKILQPKKRGGQDDPSVGSSSSSSPMTPIIERIPSALRDCHFRKGR